MKKFSIEYEFNNDKWEYIPFKDRLQDELIDIMLDKFNITDDAGGEAIVKVCCQDEDLTVLLAEHYFDEIKEKFEDAARFSYELDFEPEEPDEWEEADRYVNEKAVEHIYYGD